MLAAAISLDRPSSTISIFHDLDDHQIPAVTPVMLVVLALLGDCFSKASVP